MLSFGLQGRSGEKLEEREKSWETRGGGDGAKRRMGEGRMGIRESVIISSLCLIIYCGFYNYKYFIVWINSP